VATELTVRKFVPEEKSKAALETKRMDSTCPSLDEDATTSTVIAEPRDA
jgi:hypothetical protein